MNTNTNFKVEFFIDETDKRVAKLAKSFRRTRALDEIRPRWSKIRLGIKRFVRDQRRKAQKRKSTWMDRTNTPVNHGVNKQSK
ncbi:hypothetical protein LOAG_03434 [Loa loa]|uniref:30S ribosomal protein S21 n=1 Tax=Loa loa TaxID=7209 RepID=A0A1I7W268_LOALO|nr:hypothetical protein LOAG_03434 [Loa loa]EFO25053.1 hypothetical protein LOAG_03434 [Loa loa]